jgi:methylenetetrahydrofolate reductase (NADPH)
MTALPVPDQVHSGPVAQISAFMADFSVELTRPSDADIVALATHRPGAKAYLSMVPRRPVDETIGHAAKLRAAGLEPVPHLAVRNFTNVEAFDQALTRLKREAAVDSVLIIGGDSDEHGPFRRALDVIDSGLLRRRGIRSIGIAGYPQGHPRIGQAELQRALSDKIAAAEATGLNVEIVTQFCFDAPAILSFIAELRDFGFDHRVRVGLAGPTSLSSLMRYASRCGVRSSAHALAHRSGLMRQMFAMATPDDLIRALAEAAPVGVVPHFFSFGGIAATSRWARAVADGNIVLDAEGGFRVESSPPPRDRTFGGAPAEK